MTLQYLDPAIPTGITVFTRAYAEVIVGDITFLADAAGALPIHAVAHGTGVAGTEGIPLTEGELLTAQYGRMTFIQVPQVGTYELTVGANGIPYWAEV